jgi:hypothetical protein
MRKIILLFVFLPFISFGQKFDVGLNVGPVLFTGMSAHYGLYTSSFKLRPAIYSNMVFNMRIKHYSVGLKIGSNRVSSGNIAGIPAGSSYDRYLYAEDATHFNLLVNRYSPVSFGNLYFGVSPGLITYKNRDATFFEKFYPTTALASTSGSGYTVGGQIGCNIRLGRLVDLNFETGVQYVHINARQQADPAQFQLSYLMFPTTVGVKFKFAIGKKYQDPTTPRPKTSRPEKAPRASKGEKPKPTGRQEDE